MKAAVLAKLNQNAKQTNPNLKYQKPLKHGDKIRIALEALDNDAKRQIKAGTYKPSHHPTFSDEIFTVKKQDANNFVSLVTNKPLLAKDRFKRGDCLLIYDPKADEAEEEPTDEMDEQ